MIQEILKIINEKISLSLKIKEKLLKKQTVRSLQKYILKDKNNKQYLLEIANTQTEKFYFKRTIELQEKFGKLQCPFQLNKPLFFQIGNQFSFALYKYFEDMQEVNEDQVVELLNSFYQLNSCEVELNDENIDKILSNFLLSWPNKYHSMIKRQTLFQLYKKELQRYKTIQIAFEHGDFTQNNLFLVENEIYLMDFEFARDFQPIGFDKYDYLRSLRKNNIEEKLHFLKYQLIEIINNRIDTNNIDIELYDSFDNKILYNSWNKLYAQGFNYNSSYIWCEIWWRYYKQKNRKLFIFTIWKNDELKFLAPLYLQKNTLYLIGSNPDLYDSFAFLYKDVKYIKYFYREVLQNKYLIDFKYLDSESMEAIELIKYLYQNDINYESRIVDNKPKVILKKFILDKKEKYDIQRCKNKAIKKYHDPLEFLFSAEKTESIVTDFINIHIKKWRGGPFINIPNFKAFVKEISTTDLVIISTLSLNKKIVAYHLAYKDSRNILNSAIPSYCDDYKELSPGKVLISEIIKDSMTYGYEIFDFGRGSEEYKDWFSNKNTILFHIQIVDSNQLLVKVQKLCNRIFNKLNRIFNV